MDELTLRRITRDLNDWIVSPIRVKQLDGERYYEGHHDILTRKREAIGENGELTEVNNLPNNKIVDNRYKGLVKQKANYLLGKPLTISGEDRSYVEALKTIFDRKFQRTLKNAAISALQNGICWLYPYYDSVGELRFKLIKGSQMMPYWADDEHTEVERAVRFYQEKVYEPNSAVSKIIDKVEVYDIDGVYKYLWQSGTLKPDFGDSNNNHVSYAVTMQGGKEYNWERVPLIPVKYNEDERPLLNFVRSLQDGLNTLLSDFENNLQEDCRNTILVLKNYDGENLGSFRKNLSTYGAVKVRSDGDARGGVDTLTITVNADNYKIILDLFKKAIIENGMGYDSKDDRLSGNPNQLNIRSMYSDIDLDANDMETEFQAALDDLLWFADQYLANKLHKNYFDTNVDFIFNRDILISETQVIEDIKNSVGILSRRTLVEQHPYIDDVEEEMQRIEEEEQAELSEYRDFGGNNKGDNDNEE